MSAFRSCTVACRLQSTGQLSKGTTFYFPTCPFCRLPRHMRKFERTGGQTAYLRWHPSKARRTNLVGVILWDCLLRIRQLIRNCFYITFSRFGCLKVPANGLGAGTSFFFFRSHSPQAIVYDDQYSHCLILLRVTNVVWK